MALCPKSFLGARHALSEKRPTAGCKNMANLVARFLGT